MNCEMFNECILVWENKSLTNVEEPWEMKFRTAAVDEEYAPLRTLFQDVSIGNSYFVD